jgi:hypothetical protein
MSGADSEFWIEDIGVDRVPCFEPTVSVGDKLPLASKLGHEIVYHIKAASDRLESRRLEG